MPVLHISTVTQRYVNDALSRERIPVPQFLAWKQELEFDLEETPAEKLKCIKDNDEYYERKEMNTTSARN